MQSLHGDFRPGASVQMSCQGASGIVRRGFKNLNLSALKGGDSGGTTMAASRVVRPWE